MQEEDKQPDPYRIHCVPIATHNLGPGQILFRATKYNSPVYGQQQINQQANTTQQVNTVHSSKEIKEGAVRVAGKVNSLSRQL